MLGFGEREDCSILALKKQPLSTEQPSKET